MKTLFICLFIAGCNSAVSSNVDCTPPQNMECQSVGDWSYCMDAEENQWLIVKPGCHGPIGNPAPHAGYVEEKDVCAANTAPIPKC